jgi:hypothetical protein
MRASIFLAALALAGQALAGDGPPYSTSIVIAKVKFCKASEPGVCREIEIVPQGHDAVSVVECLRGVSMASAEFMYEGELWRTRGGRCVEEPSAVRSWLAGKALR